MSQYHFIEPLGLLFLRGNKLFGEAGSYGAAQIPPWPSVAAGALRSSILVQDGVDLPTFSKGEVVHPSLGTPAKPGAFRVTDFRFGLQKEGESLQGVYPLPTDLVVSEDDNKVKTLRKLTPQPVPKGVLSSFNLAKVPLLVEENRSKPVSGQWLSEAGWQAYLQGELPQVNDLLESSALWKSQDRTGIGMNADSGAVEKGRLFSTQATALCEDVGFLLATSGSDVQSCALRLGGDGGAAQLEPVAFTPSSPDYEAILKERRCRIVLTSPALFSGGWRLSGLAVDSDRFELRGVKARLCSAAVSRTETISGWDLAKGQPKTALRSVAAGSVYWLDELEGSPEALQALLAFGLWGENQEYAAVRQAEGFNRFQFARY